MDRGSTMTERRCSHRAHRSNSADIVALLGVERGKATAVLLRGEHRPGGAHGVVVSRRIAAIRPRHPTSPACAFAFYTRDEFARARIPQSLARLRNRDNDNNAGPYRGMSQ